MSLFCAVVAGLTVQSSRHELIQQRGIPQKMIKLDLGSGAACLDGTPFAFYIIPGDTASFSIGIHGGGWCYDETDCETRALTALGSSSTWNLTSCFHAPAFSCMGLESNCTQVFLPYCDGASFSSYREAPVSVPNSTAKLLFRGTSNLDRTLDALISDWGLGDAKDVVLTGGSAGGLSTYLHLDRVAARLPQATVVGAPNAGYFLDHQPMPNGDFRPLPPKPQTYPASIKYLYNMSNASGSLSQACQEHYSNGDAWKCMMAPYAQAFIKTPFFSLQSRFDEWQMGPGIAGVPCLIGQEFAPPYKHDPTHVCNASEREYIVSYGKDFITQFTPVLESKTNGCFLVSCIQHGVNALLTMNNKSYTFVDALTAWRTHSPTGEPYGFHFVDDCGQHGTEPCNPSVSCAPF
eukprot:m.46851 g.46851  ORF g.46851 m.46851 type:complete len:406 (-) comp20351_c0_seq1:99-1316(-)